MKKENVVKKVLLKSLGGFFVGVTLLMIAYASIYFIAGENVFIEELSQLQNIKTFILQIIVTGVAYYFAFIVFHIIGILQNFDKYVTEHPYKSTIALLILFAFILGIIMALLSSPNVYSKNITVINIYISVSIFALSGLVFCFKKPTKKQ